MLGVVLKLFTSYFGAAMHAVYLTLGLALSTALYLLLVRLGIRPWSSAGISAALSATPAFLLYENWLFYEYPVAALLVLSALALHEFLRRGTVWPGLAFFALLAALIYTRSIFHVVWLLLTVALLLLVRPDLRRPLLAASAVPALLVVLLIAKNVFVFAVPATSSWFGINLAQMFSSVPLAERRELVERGELSRVSLVEPLSSPAVYLRVILVVGKPLVQPPRATSVPVLDHLKKSTGCWNMNHLVLVRASRDYLGDAITLIRLRPRAYANAILDGVNFYLRPGASTSISTGRRLAATRPASIGSRSSR